MFATSNLGIQKDNTYDFSKRHIKNKTAKYQMLPKKEWSVLFLIKSASYNYVCKIQPYPYTFTNFHQDLMKSSSFSYVIPTL